MLIMKSCSALLSSVRVIISVSLSVEVDTARGGVIVTNLNVSPFISECLLFLTYTSFIVKCEALLNSVAVNSIR